MDKLQYLLEKNGISSPVNREQKALESRIAQLEEQNAMLLECLLEMSEIVYS